MAFLNRDQVLGAKDLITETVEVPEWGGTANVRALNGKERGQLERMFAAGRKDGVNMGTDKEGPTWGNWRAWLLTRAMVDENLKPAFPASDIEALGAKSAAALDRVAGAIMKLSGLSDKEQKEMEKNSGETATDDSSSE